MAQGERSLGWKVAFSAPQVLERLAISGPLAGFLTDAVLVESGSTCPLAGWTKPAFEPEIAVHMGQDLEPGSSRAATEGAIAGLGPAIELADLDVPLDELEEVVATNIFNRGLVLGGMRPGADPAGLRGRISRDGVETDLVEHPTELIGDVVELTRHVADLLGAVGERLRAGEVIITGSIIPVIFVSPGERVRYELEPLEALEIAFS
jgi:2-keto-4-pentenoate hydratase